MDSFETQILTELKCEALIIDQEDSEEEMKTVKMNIIIMNE